MSKQCEIEFTLESEQIDFSLAQDNMAFGIEGQYIMGEGTSDYNRLSNKPQINGVTLIGNKTGEELYLQEVIEDITAQEIDQIIYGG